MKMKNVLTMKTLSAAVVASIALLASCSKSNDAGSVLSATDSQNVNSESVSNSTANEAADVSNSVMNNVSDTNLSTARVEAQGHSVIGLGLKDGRLAGATITISGSGTKDLPKGTITITWPTGTVGGDGVTRSGTITIQYYGRRAQPNSWRRISFTNFTRNSVQVSGSYHRFVADTTETSTDLTVTFKDTTNVTLTFPDNTTITRNAFITVVWDYVIATPANSTITHKAGSSASGTTRKGGTYAMSITTDLVYPASCIASGDMFPQSGVKSLTVTPSGSVTPLVYTLTYGDGTSTCNKTVTVELNGKTIKTTGSTTGN